MDILVARQGNESNFSLISLVLFLLTHRITKLTNFLTIVLFFYRIIMMCSIRCDSIVQACLGTLSRLI